MKSEKGFVSEKSRNFRESWMKIFTLNLMRTPIRGYFLNLSSVSSDHYLRLASDDLDVKVKAEEKGDREVTEVEELKRSIPESE